MNTTRADLTLNSQSSHQAAGNIFKVLFSLKYMDSYGEASKLRKKSRRSTVGRTPLLSAVTHVDDITHYSYSTVHLTHDKMWFNL